MKKNLKKVYSNFEKEMSLKNFIVGVRDLNGKFITRGEIKTGKLITFSELNQKEKEIFITNAPRQPLNP